MHLWTTTTRRPRAGTSRSPTTSSRRATASRSWGYISTTTRNALGYENVVIEDNVIWTGNGQGILLEYVVGASVSNNALLQPPGDGERTPLIHVRQDSRDILIEDNILNGVEVNSKYASSVVEKGSVGLQWEDRFAADHYINALIDPLQTLPDVDALRATPGGIVEARDVGADMMRIDRSPSTLDGYIETERGSGFDLSDYPFDATNVWGPEGRVNMSGATVTWDFGDGSTGRGLRGRAPLRGVRNL